MKLLKCQLLLLIIMSQYAFSQLTLQNAVDLATGRSSAVKSAEHRLAAKEYALKSSYGNWFPSIDVSTFYTYMDRDLILDLDPIRSVIINVQTENQVSFANIENLLTKGVPLSEEEKNYVRGLASKGLDQKIPHFEETVKEQFFPQVLVSLKQPIFTGGKITAGIKVAESQVEASKFQLNMEEENLKLSVITYYIKSALAEKNYDVRLKVKEGIAKHYDKADKLFIQGVIPKNEKLRASVALSLADNNLFEAQEKMKLSNNALFSVMKNDVDSYPIFDSLYYFSNKIDLNELIGKTKANNLLLSNIRANYNALNYKADAVEADYFPTVFGYGFYNPLKHYAASIEPEWGIGLGASWTVFDGLKRTNNHQEVKQEAEALKMTIEEAERKLELQVRNFYTSYLLAEKNYNYLTSAREQALENFELNEQRFNNGLGTSLEVIDAQLSLEAIELKIADALSEMFINLANLYNVSGQTDNFLQIWNSHH